MEYKIGQYVKTNHIFIPRNYINMIATVVETRYHLTRQIKIKFSSGLIIEAYSFEIDLVDLSIFQDLGD